MVTVQQLIDILSKIDDKSLPVCLEDWNEGWAFPDHLSSVKVVNDRISTSDGKKTTFVLLDIR